MKYEFWEWRGTENSEIACITDSMPILGIIGLTALHNLFPRRRIGIWNVLSTTVYIAMYCVNGKSITRANDEASYLFVLARILPLKHTMLQSNTKYSVYYSEHYIYSVHYQNCLDNWCKFYNYVSWNWQYVQYGLLPITEIWRVNNKQ